MRSGAERTKTRQNEYWIRFICYIDSAYLVYFFLLTVPKTAYLSVFESVRFYPVHRLWMSALFAPISYSSGYFAYGYCLAVPMDHFVVMIDGGLGQHLCNSNKRNCWMIRNGFEWNMKLFMIIKSSKWVWSTLVTQWSNLINNIYDAGMSRINPQTISNWISNW